MQSFSKKRLCRFFDALAVGASPGSAHGFNYLHIYMQIPPQISSYVFLKKEKTFI